MKKNVILLSIVIATAFVLQGCGAKEDSVMHEQMDGDTATIASGDFYEACDMEKKWTPGTTVNYSFNSSKPVMFEIHYHEKHAKMYPVEPTLADNIEGSFVVKSDAIHCCMWKNENPDPVTVTFDMSVAGQK